MYFGLDLKERDGRSLPVGENEYEKLLDLGRPLPPLPALPPPLSLPPDHSLAPTQRPPINQPYDPRLQEAYRSQKSFRVSQNLPRVATDASFLPVQKQRTNPLNPPERRWLGSLADFLSRCSNDWWLVEILCWIAGAICIGSIVLVLILYNGQPLPPTWPLGITLNAFISVISAIGKYSLAVPLNESLGELKWLWYTKRPSSATSTTQGRRLIDFETFDLASRSPWGAFLLATRLRTRSIASIGATITVLTLALDPVFQQIVTYPQRPRSIGKSTVNRVVSYEPVEYSYLQNGTKVRLPPDSITTAIGGIIVDSLGAFLTPPPVFCPSDDCKWPPFQTLGVCSQCQDISKYLTLTCLQEPGDWKSARARTKNGTNYPWSKSCGYFLNASSETPTLMTGYNIAENGSMGEALGARTISLHDFDSGMKFWDGSLLFKSAKVPLVDFITAGVPVGSSPYSNSTPLALECVYKWCVKTIESTFVNGNLSENMLSSFQNDSQSIPDLIEADASSKSYNGLSYHFHNESITPPGQNITFSVHNVTTLEFSAALSTIFPSSLTVPNLDSQYSLKYQIQTGLGTKAIFTNFTAMRPPQNVSDNVERLATLLTNVLRSTPNGTEQVFGSGSFETFIHVRFGWLAFPVTVLFATLAFLIATIRKASRAKAGIWKTSSLATLMHGMSWDAKMSGVGGSLWRMEEMKDKAKHLSVYLERWKEGGTLDCEYQAVDEKSSWERR